MKNRKRCHLMMLMLAVLMVLLGTCMTVQAVTPTLSSGKLYSVTEKKKYTITSITHNGKKTYAYYTKKGTYSRGDTTYSCAALVKRFYKNTFGINVYNLVSSKSVPKISESNKGSFAKTTSPVPGDIVRWESGVHWAIVKSVSGSKVTVIQQNFWWNSKQCAPNIVIDKNLKNFSFWHYSKNNIKVKEIALNTITASVKVGSYLQLKAAVKPSYATNKQVRWESSNSKIATVSATGKVKGIKTGTVIIRCIAKDGSKKVGACKVTVKKATASASSSSSGSSVTQIPSTLCITNAFVPAGTYLTGSAFTVSGLVQSNYALKSVTASVKTTAGVQKFGCTVTLGANVKSYALYGMDAKMLFSKLPSGTYVFTVTATDEKETRTLVSKKFTVKSGNFTNSGITYPGTLDYGSDFRIAGTVGSSDKLSKVQVWIHSASTGKCMSSGSVSTTAASYNVNNLDKYLNFKSLAKGKYIYRLSVKNAMGIEKYVVTKSFTVK